MTEAENELILVYNADSGIFNTIKDGINKIVSPRTYQCNLCALTYGTITMKDEWRTFIDNLGISSEFLHRDEFLKRLEFHPHNVKNIEFPAIFIRKKEQVVLFINYIEINKCRTLQDLMDLITRKLSGKDSSIDK